MEAICTVNALALVMISISDWIIRGSGININANHTIVASHAPLIHGTVLYRLQ